MNIKLSVARICCRNVNVTMECNSQPHSGTSSSISDSPIPSSFFDFTTLLIHNSLSFIPGLKPTCLQILPPVISLLPPGLPSQTIAHTISSELLGFCFSLCFVSLPYSRLSWRLRQLWAHTNLLYRKTDTQSLLVCLFLVYLHWLIADLTKKHRLLGRCSLQCTSLTMRCMTVLGTMSRWVLWTILRYESTRLRMVSTWRSSCGSNDPTSSLPCIMYQQMLVTVHWWMAHDCGKKTA